MSLNDSIQEKVIAPAPWHVQVWQVDADFAFNNPASTTGFYEPTSILEPSKIPEVSIATLR
jgi:hypothetical protein